MLHPFPKIFAVGTNYIRDLLNEPVEITEKVDGSQFVFGKDWTDRTRIHMRSKGAQIFVEDAKGMFKTAVDRVLDMQERLEPGVSYYAEYLQKPRHNVLTYSRVPKNNLALFGAVRHGGEFVSDHAELTAISERLEIDVCPLIFSGLLDSAEKLQTLSDRDSFLGGAKIEGVVIKNYARPFLLGGQPIPLMAGKLVRSEFKEVCREVWGKENTSPGQWETFVQSFRTEARWHKAIQRLRETGKLTGSAKDIGPLIASVKADIESEEKEEIKNFLWKTYGQDVLRRSVAGLPEFYKEQLSTGAVAV